jgi:epoxide hydrolase
MTVGGRSRRNLLKAGACALLGSLDVLRGTSALAFEKEGSAVTPFTFHAPQAALDDLKLRLQRARCADRETVNDWSQGVLLAKLQALVAYWRTGYDWRRCEAKLNSFAQYRAEIDGTGIHFLHVRSPHVAALPIVITHGWPGSVMEFFQGDRSPNEPYSPRRTSRGCFSRGGTVVARICLLRQAGIAGLERRPYREGVG